MNTSLPLAQIAVIILGAYLVLRLLVHLVNQLTAKNYIDEPYDSIIKAILRWVVIIITLLVILQVIGIPVSHVFATLSAVLVLVAVGFVAIWSVLSNILCAFLLLLSPPFSFGDEIELRDPDKAAGIRGKVINLNLFYTTLQACIDGVEGKETFRIPNTLFFQRVIICHATSEGKDLKFGGINTNGSEQDT